MGRCFPRYARCISKAVATVRWGRARVCAHEKSMVSCRLCSRWESPRGPEGDWTHRRCAPPGVSAREAGANQLSGPTPPAPLPWGRGETEAGSHRIRQPPSWAASGSARQLRCLAVCFAHGKRALRARALREVGWVWSRWRVSPRPPVGRGYACGWGTPSCRVWYRWWAVQGFPVGRGIAGGRCRAFLQGVVSHVGGFTLRGGQGPARLCTGFSYATGSRTQQSSLIIPARQRSSVGNT